MIGDEETFLAVKNRSSYLIGSSCKGLKIIENQKEIYSEILNLADGYIDDIIYANHLNCYLLHLSGKTYRKDIDQEPPYLFMDFDCGWRLGGCLKYSKRNQRLIVSKEGDLISVISLERKRTELNFSSGGLYWQRQKITDFRLFGKDENGILALTPSGRIFLYFLNYSRKKVCTFYKYKIELIQERDEFAFSISICDESKYVLVCLADDCDYISRFIVLKLEGRRLNPVASLDKYGENLLKILSPSFCGFFGSHARWIGFSSFEYEVCIFDFDKKTKELKYSLLSEELHQETGPQRLNRSGDYLYYTGCEGKVMRLRVNFVDLKN